MPDDPEVETNDLQEAIDEMHEEKSERESEQKQNAWTRYIGLSTAILAVFAAIGSLQAASLVNEAQINQLHSSDKWNEYQASKEKGHIYTVAANEMLDAGITLSSKSHATAAGPKGAASAKVSKTANPPKTGWTKMSPGARLAEYESEVAKENAKQGPLSKSANELSAESQEQIGNHEQFAYSVALIQVAIALGAVAALARLKTIWYCSLLCGLAGILYFGLGFRTIKRASANEHRLERPAPPSQPSPNARSPRTAESPGATPG